jgi:hypothetical protein
MTAQITAVGQLPLAGIKVVEFSQTAMGVRGAKVSA